MTAFTILVVLAIVYAVVGACVGLADRLHMRKFDEHGDWVTTGIIVVLWPVVALLIIIDATGGNRQ